MIPYFVSYMRVRLEMDTTATGIALVVLSWLLFIVVSIILSLFWNLCLPEGQRKADKKAQVEAVLFPFELYRLAHSGAAFLWNRNAVDHALYRVLDLRILSGFKSGEGAAWDQMAPRSGREKSSRRFLIAARPHIVQ